MSRSARFSTRALNPRESRGPHNALGSVSRSAARCVGPLSLLLAVLTLVTRVLHYAAELSSHRDAHRHATIIVDGLIERPASSHVEDEMSFFLAHVYLLIP